MLLIITQVPYYEEPVVDNVNYGILRLADLVFRHRDGEKRSGSPLTSTK